MFNLYPHQQAALEKANQAKSFAFLMPPGTGKTFTLLEEVKHLYSDKKIDTLIVISPKILVRQWGRAIEEYYNNSGSMSYNIIVYKSYSKRYSTMFNCLNIFLLNIESFSREKSKSIQLLKHLFSTNRKFLLCIDESSKIKNHKAALTSNVLGVTKDKDMYKRILTGSIVTESPMDFYTQFQFLDPNITGFRNYYMFRHHYAVLTDAYTGFGMVKKIDGYKNINELVSKITPHCFLLDLKDVEGMPEKIKENIYVELNEEQRRMYEKLKKESILELEKNPLEELNIVSAMDKLFKFFRILQGHYLDSKQINPKIVALQELLEIYPGKFLIFCRFVDDIDHIANVLDNIGIIRGDVSPNERQEVIDNFKNDKIKHLVCMQQIGSFGLDFPEANYVAYFSCNFSYDQRMQSESRATRLSSKGKSVTYFNIIAEDTVEERLYLILKSKETMFINILNLLKQS